MRLLSAGPVGAPTGGGDAISAAVAALLHPREGLGRVDEHRLHDAGEGESERVLRRSVDTCRAALLAVRWCCGFGSDGGARASRAVAFHASDSLIGGAN
jgi:hypothetical protein